MASAYSTDLQLELMVTGENAGTWGDKTNNNLNLIQQAIAGYEAVTITDSATTALVMSQAAISNARNMVIKIASITLTGATTVTIPNGIEKFYIFDLTAVTGVTNLTIKTASGTGFTAGEAKIVAAYSDGTNLNEIALDTLGGTIGSAQIDDSSIITAKISDNAVTTAKITNLAITTPKIAASAITQAKLASGSVGADQLISTGVTAGSYTAANITIDAGGRITSATAGSDKGWVYVAGCSRSAYNFCGWNTPVTFTANPAANKIGVLLGGAGGSGGIQYGGNTRNQSGGNGGLGFWVLNIPAHPYSQDYYLGYGGEEVYTGQGTGCAGEASYFGPAPAPLAIANGGNGGGGNPGNSPGADFTYIEPSGTNPFFTCSCRGSFAFNYVQPLVGSNYCDSYPTSGQYSGGAGVTAGSCGRNNSPNTGDAGSGRGGGGIIKIYEMY